MSDEKRAYLIAYDVVDDRRRTRIAKILSGYGERLQYSVFYCETRPARLIRIKEKVTAEMDDEEDSVLVVDCGMVAQAKRSMEFIGCHSYADVAVPTII